MSLPGGILNNPRWQALGENGEILPEAQLFAYTSGGTFSTPQALYADANFGSPLANPVVADDSGRFPAMYLFPTSYDLRLKDADDNIIWSCENVEDIGQTFLANLGVELAEGSRDVTSGYTVTDTDNLITVDSTGGANPCIINLQPAADRGLPLTIKNVGTIALAVTPDGAETIDEVTGAFTVAAASSPTFPTIVLLPDPDGSGYWIQASHGL